MNFKRFAAAVSAAAVVCLLALPACSGKGGSGDNPGASGDLLAQIQSKGEITIALEGTWAPWGYHDENNQLVGYDVEIGQAIADKLKRENGIDYKASEVLVTVGLSEAVFAVLATILEEGDEILVPDPGWLNYVNVPDLLGAVPVPYLLR